MVVILEEGSALLRTHSLNVRLLLLDGMSSDLHSQDTFDIRILMAKSVKYTVNFLEAKEEDLYRYVFTHSFEVYVREGCY